MSLTDAPVTMGVAAPIVVSAGTPRAPFRPRAEGAPTVADLLRSYGPRYLRRTVTVSTIHERSLLQKLMDCRQGPLGSHAYHCAHCGHVRITASPCHNRHCPNCVSPRRSEWLEEVQYWSLETSYLHAVFTLPHELNRLILHAVNRGWLLRRLFTCASHSLLRVFARRYGCKPGMVMVLHTWGQSMKPHVHCHILLTAGGLALDGQSWIEISLEEKTLLELRKQLALEFRAQYLKALKKLYRDGELSLLPSMSAIHDEKDFERWLAPLRRKGWVVHCGGPPEGQRTSDRALRYLARYVTGTCIHDGRILSDDGTFVTIRLKDYRTGQYTTLTMRGEAFVTRYVFHILPKGLSRVRYAGIFYARDRQARLEQCRALIAQHQGEEPPSEPLDLAAFQQERKKCAAERRCGRTCPRCGTPGFTWSARYRPDVAAYVIGALAYYWASITTSVDTFRIDTLLRNGWHHRGPAVQDPAEYLGQEPVWYCAFSSTHVHVVYAVADTATTCLPLPDW